MRQQPQFCFHTKAAPCFRKVVFLDISFSEIKLIKPATKPKILSANLSCKKKKKNKDFSC